MDTKESLRDYGDYAKELFLLLLSSQMPIADKKEYIYQLDALMSIIAEKKLLDTNVRKEEIQYLSDSLKNLERIIQKHPQRVLYPVIKKGFKESDFDRVPAFIDILYIDNLTKTMEEVEFVIGQMKNISQEDKDEHLTSIQLIRMSFFQALHEVKIKNRVLHPTIKKKVAQQIQAVYYRATNHNKYGKNLEWGGLIGLIIKLYHTVTGA